MPGNYYNISVDDKIIKKLKSNADGSLIFSYYTGSKTLKIVISISDPL